MSEEVELQRRIEALKRSRATLEERQGFAHKRRKLTLDTAAADQAREEERAARVELERLDREIYVLESRLRLFEHQRLAHDASSSAYGCFPGVCPRVLPSIRSLLRMRPEAARCPASHRIGAPSGQRWWPST